MHKGRLEAYSDAVMAIILTIMVLELRAPHGAAFGDLAPLAPKLASYALSFVYLSIYWHNHHHMLQAAQRIDGATLWANSALLFCLSFVPFATSWIGETRFAATPMGVYGAMLLSSGICYTLLSSALKRVNGADSKFAEGLGADAKGKISLAIYAVGIATSPWAPALSGGLYALVAALWLIPDKRFARVTSEAGGAK